MTTDRDDYLWDPRATPEADVAALEHALRPLRWTLRPLDPALLRRTAGPAPRGSRWRSWRLRVATVAAALLVGLWLVFANRARELRPGDGPREFVATATAMQVQLGELAAIELEPGTRLSFAHWRADEARFRLQQGGIVVRVAPPPAVPPRFFCIDTPRSQVVDLGCRYELRILPDGREVVRVTEGAVEFAAAGRRVFVPAGARARMHGGRVSTPVFVDCPPRLAEVVDKFDGLTSRGVERDDRRKIADMIASLCRGGRDTLPLFHLLRDEDAWIVELAEARLVELEDLPAGADPGSTKGAPPHADAELWLAHLRLGAWARGN